MANNANKPDGCTFSALLKRIEELTTELVLARQQRKNVPIGYYFALADRRLLETHAEHPALSVLRGDLHSLLKSLNLLQKDIWADELANQQTPRSLEEKAIQSMGLAKKTDPEISQTERAALVVNALYEAGLWGDIH